MNIYIYIYIYKIGIFILCAIMIRNPNIIIPKKGTSAATKPHKEDSLRSLGLDASHILAQAEVCYVHVSFCIQHNVVKLDGDQGIPFRVREGVCVRACVCVRECVCVCI